MKINPDKIKHNNLAYFRFKNLNGKVLLTNEIGEFIFLKESEFNDFLEGKLEKSGKLYKELAEKSFLKKEIKEDDLAQKYANRKHFLFSGPSLHIFILTARCDNKCVYCHASAQSMEKEGVDMNKETAQKAVNLAFKTPSKALAIEFQGGEPLANWEVLKFIVQEAKKLNKKKKKNLEFRLVTNLNLMTQEKLDFLIDSNISICTSFDGPEKVHNKNRIWSGKGSGSYQNVTKWTKEFHKQKDKLKKKKYKHNIHAIATISRDSLKYPKQIIDEYIKQGFDTISINTINPYGFSKKAWEKVGYSSVEYINFYKKMLDYLIELNLAGKKIKEKNTNVYLEKIRSTKDPNMLELRSPCGAGIGQLAYNYNGDVYTCDEGRMLSMMGDESFKLGSVGDGYKKIIDNATVKSMCSASCLESVPGCSDCAYLPYCGICPIYNYSEQGNLLGQMPTNERCKINKAVLDYLFEKMQNKDIKEIFKGWVKNN